MTFFASASGQVVTIDQTEPISEPATSDNIKVAFSGIATESAENATSKLNLGLGVFLEAPFKNQLSFETGVYYLEKVYRLTGANGDFEVHSDRLHIPVLLRYTPSKFLSIGIGPYGSFRLGDEERVRAPFRISDSEQGIDSIRRWEMGIDTSVLILFPFENQAGLFLETRYSGPFDANTRHRLESKFIYLAGIKFQL